jgi:hypothetical protein
VHLGHKLTGPKEEEEELWQNTRPLRASYARTKSISETDSLWKKHYALPHFQLIFPRQHGLYPPQGQENILHMLELYQKKPTIRPNKKYKNTT